MHTVLLVDDDAHVLSGLARALRTQPYQLYRARSAEEAMYVFKVHQVDVIVADQRMPGMSGCDLLAWVANNYPETVRIMLTGYPSGESAIRAINEASVYQFFTKPCNHAHLAVAIRKALEQKDLLGAHGRLLEGNRQRSQNMEIFYQELDILQRTIAGDLRKPLDLVAQSCRSLAANCQDVFDAKTASLVDNALEAVGEVQRLVLRLAQHVRTQRPIDDGDESAAGPPSTPSSASPEYTGQNHLLSPT